MPEPIDTAPYTSAAVQLYAAALNNAKSTTNRDVLQEWWKLYDNARQLADIMACLDIHEEGGRSYRVRNAEILSCDQQEDGGFTLIWQEAEEDETREARLGSLANPAYRLVKELADVCIAQGLRANLLCGYEPNSRGWSVMVKGKKAVPDYFRRVFRVQPIRESGQAQRPQPAAVRAAPPRAPERTAERTSTATDDDESWDAAMKGHDEGAPGPLAHWIAQTATLVSDTRIADLDSDLTLAINGAFGDLFNGFTTEQKNAFMALTQQAKADGQLSNSRRPITLAELAIFDAIALKVTGRVGQPA